MQVFGSSCDVLAHAGSLIVNSMNHLSCPLPHCCHAHIWYQLSIDVQWVSCACNWIVCVVLFGSKGLCSGQTCGMLCTGIFGWALKPFKMSRISTFGTSILVFVSQSRIKALLLLLWRSLFTILLVCLLLLDLWFFCTCHFGNSVC